jgi:hypothetical protein
MFESLELSNPGYAKVGNSAFDTLGPAGGPLGCGGGQPVPEPETAARNWMIFSD